VARRYLPPPTRRHPLRTPAALAGIAVVAVFVIVWWVSDADEAGPESEIIADTPMAQADDTPAPPAAPAKTDAPVERGAKPKPPEEAPPPPNPERVKTAVEAGQKALAKDDVLTARVQMSAALRAGAAGEQATELRAKLVQLANHAVFSPARVSGDPHTATYVVKKGDTLRKIAKQYKITPELIARVNSLANMSMIREGARLKIVNGPFGAVVHKGEHVMDIFLDDVLVRTYKVGLGEHDSTPTGTWKVKNKLTNPTYFPPRGGKIVQADDPNNPLGEHWLGLEGIAGEAKSQLRYGIHGTNEPDSIGKNLSLGCIRLHNQDVNELYTLLVIGHSQVAVKP